MAAVARPGAAPRALRRPPGLLSGAVAVSPATLLAALCLAVGVLAAVPRLDRLDRPVTVDEALWFGRTTAFGAAIARRDWRDTYQTGHPGVTTMWLGLAGMGLDQAQALAGVRLRMTSADRLEAFLAARRTMALASSVLLALVTALVARALGGVTAALAGLLLALDPWLVAHERILHLDGLLAALLAVCVLGCFARWHRGGSRALLLLAGMAGGLAVLTKSSALVLLPPLVLVLAVAAHGRSLRALALDLALLGGVAALTALLCWPALLADPLGVAARVVRFGETIAGQPHEQGSFFLGRRVADPGPLFYAAVLAFRLSPLVVLGLVLWAAAPLLRRRSRPLADCSAGWLLASALLVVLLMMLAAKKLDRYILPAVPLLVIVAAAGIARTLAVLRAGRLSRGLALGMVGLGQLALCAGARPYFFSYYSPLLGGVVAAERVLPVGWGEGLDQVAAYLNGRPGSERQRIYATDTVRLSLRPSVRGQIVAAVNRRVGYAVSYIAAAQRGDERLPRRKRLVLTVRIDGTEYAHVYALTRS